ncbi:MAG: efflux RND transporter periplasmic adaptor subunit [Planctomycetota bacterium]|nr:efflux RND transporter periplasmic adaptor subunit [Planctomycetota bacterium]
MKTILKIVAPILIVALAAGGAAWMIINKPPPGTSLTQVSFPLVRVTEVRPQDVRFTVRTQGRVVARAEGNLAPEVSGKVVALSPALVRGGFFQEGEVLVALDDADFKLAVVRAEAGVAQTEARLKREESEAAVARSEWERLGEGEPGPLVLRVPQLAEARATLAAAKADLEKAQRDLARTQIRAPYAGRVLEKSMDLGEFVNRGASIARIYATDYAEVRLPIPDHQLAYLNLPLFETRDDAHAEAPRVILRIRFAGKDHEWEGRVVRTEAEIDAKSRMVTAIARIEDPYSQTGDPDRPPLALGLFVEAEIQGRDVQGVVVLPREALRNGDTIFVIDESDRLRFRKVEVLREDIGTVVVKSGLASGERVCLSPLEVATDGMQVRTDKGSTAPSAADGEKSP